MTAHPDNFDGPDGPLDAGWLVFSGTCTQAGGSAVTAGSGMVHDTTTTEAGEQDHYLLAPISGSVLQRVGLLFKWDPATNTGWHLQVYTQDGVLNIVLRIWEPPWFTVEVSTTHAIPPDGPVKIRAHWLANHIDIYINDDEVISRDKGWYASNTSFGWFLELAASTISAFDSMDEPARSMIVLPDPVYSGAGILAMTVIGTNTEWDPGPPADTVFSCDRGTLYSQVVLDATTAILYWTPGGALFDYLFSETKYGLEYLVTTTIDPTLQVGGECMLSIPGAALVNRTGAESDTSLLLTDETPVDGVASLTFPEALASITYALGGIAAQPAPTHPIASILSLIYQAANASTDIGAGPFSPQYDEPLATTLRTLHTIWTDRPATGFYTVVSALDELLDAISPSHAVTLDDLEADLGIHGQVLYASLLSAIRALRGDDVSSVLGILSELSTIRSAHSYTLEDVIDAIAAVAAPDLSAITHKLDHIQPDEADTLTTIQHQADATKAVADAISSSLTAYRTGSSYTVQSILDAITDLDSDVAALGHVAAPVWPGLAGATVGGSTPLSDGLTVTGPLHGLLLAITSQPVNAHSYPFGAIHSWSHVGQCVFTSDRGDSEMAQRFGLDAQILCPKTMASAASATLRVNNGWGGTVRPFTIT